MILPIPYLYDSVVTFLGAFCCVFFQASNIQARSLVGTLSATVAILILWCIVTSWETRKEGTEEKRPLSYEERQCAEFEDHRSAYSPPKISIFEKIRSLPVLMYIRSSLDFLMYIRNSLDSGGTTVV
jgi:hypothetical protein